MVREDGGGRPIDAMHVVLRDVERQMTMRRPWDVAEDWSQWAISGTYPTGGEFTNCLAVVLPRYVHGTDQALFVFIGPMAGDPPVDSSRITSAVPLLLVLRDEPGTAYWEDEQVWLDRIRP